MDASGNLWIFTGIGYDSIGNSEYLNDLWEYTPSATGNTGEWTWMGGSGTVPFAGDGPSGVYGSLGTPSSTNVPGGRSDAVSWVDASGNLWLFGGNGDDSTGALGYLNDLWKYTRAQRGTRASGRGWAAASQSATTLANPESTGC